MTGLSLKRYTFFSYTIFEKIFEIALAYNIIKANIYIYPFLNIYQLSHLD